MANRMSVPIYIATGIVYPVSHAIPAAPPIVLAARKKASFNKPRKPKTK